MARVRLSFTVSSDSSFNKEDHIFGNVGGNVSDALQALGNLHHVDGLGGARDVLLNEFPGRSRNFLVERINAPVGAPNFMAALRVFVREGAEYF
jgi:hypothetical protein